MFTTLVAVLCHALVARGPETCVEDIVTDSNLDPHLTLMSCKMIAEPGLAQWFASNPKYVGWRLAGWKCMPGHYTPARPI